MNIYKNNNTETCSLLYSIYSPLNSPDLLLFLLLIVIFLYFHILHKKYEGFCFSVKMPLSEGIEIHGYIRRR